MKTLYKLLTLFLFLNIALLNAQVTDSPEITAEEIQEHINFLASDELKGRGSGTEEIFKAAEYIESEFQKSALLPLFNESYFQEFSFVESVELTENNNFTIISPKEKNELKLNENFTVAPFSGNAAVLGELVFAGFGISAPDIDYDDYANQNVEGKIVIVIRSTPEPETPHSKFDSYSSLRKKAAVARDKGAIGIIFVNGYEQHKSSDDLIEFNYNRGGAVTDFAVVNVTKDIIEKIFSADQKNFEDYYNKIVNEKKPYSFLINEFYGEINTEISEVEKVSWNVAGYFEGTDPELKNEFVIIGAHFDHLGMGGEGSLDMSNTPQIHNGADDNASGTAGVLELAEKFSSLKNNLKRSVLFITFSGEELGLLGSNYFVNNMPFPVSDAACMINMDMIGRMDNDTSLIVYGVGTSSNFKDYLNDLNSYGFNLTLKDDGYGPSDHSSFYGKKIPVLFFFTDTHEDYHKPSDDADKINAAGEEMILNYIFNVSEKIINDDIRPDYLVVERKDTENIPARKVWVGTIPDFAGEVDGYKISGVSEGSPAELSGLQGGDIIIQFGDKKISNIYDFTYALADYAPGQMVNVKVKRGEEILDFEMTLASR